MAVSEWELNRDTKHIRIAVLAFLMFLWLKIFTEMLIFDHIVALGFRDYIADKLAYLIFTPLALCVYLLLNPVIATEPPFQGSKKIGKNVLMLIGVIAASMSGLSLCFSGLQVYILSFLSYEYAASLWDFEVTRVHISRNAALGNQLDSVLLFVLCHVILGPSVEESVFRGVIFNRLLLRLGFVCAVVMGSFAFMILHPIKLWFDVFISSVVYCYIFYKTGSLLMVIVLHGLQNLFGWLITGFGLVEVFKNKDPSELNLMGTWTAEFIVLAVFLPVAVCLIRIVVNFEREESTVYAG